MKLSEVHKTYILFMRSLSVAAPGLKVTCIGGDAAVEMEMVVRDTCRRQYHLFGHVINPYESGRLYDDGRPPKLCDVRWVWFESEAEIIRGENRALEEQGKVINGECECHV